LRFTSDLLIWRSFLEIPGNRDHWRDFGKSVHRAKSQDARLLCLPLEYFSVRSRRHLDEVVIRAAAVAKKVKISVAFGVQMLGEKWSKQSREMNDFIRRSQPSFPASWSGKKGWLRLWDQTPIKAKAEWDRLIRRASESRCFAWVTRRRSSFKRSEFVQSGNCDCICQIIASAIEGAVAGAIYKEGSPACANS
jgi:hypothetical protein